MWRIIILCIVTMSIADTNTKVSYEGYKIFSHIPKQNTHLEMVKGMKIDGDGYRFLRDPSFLFREVFIIVGPENLTDFYELMSDFNADFEVRSHNVQSLIDATIPQSPSKFDFESYHTLQEIYDNLDELATMYPKMVHIVVGGTTFEGREIKGVKLFSDSEKSGVFLEGGIHGREWISPATVMYILHQLVTSDDPDVKYIRENHNWIIFPVFNPDGYVYSHEKDRLWCKNRNLAQYYPTCFGVDLNRNWDFRWNKTGWTNNPCDDTYPGYVWFSEVETDSMSKFMSDNIEHFDSYISFRGFSQRLMFSVGNTDASTLFSDQLLRLGSIAVEGARKVYGTNYTVGRINNFHRSSGLSVDYVSGVLRKSIVFMFELRDEGQYGFLLPPDQIIPTANETLNALTDMFKTLSNGFL
ncbi:PREDICTED: zinc carboxypeptidase-like [Vollenhovia emeryi]|uniref:zinc carboxypeptidase-like n=1 Tax=Vollenhovia emeryi TaxID=411798 RepID=UPI0005F4D49C|nr:PREDICTED: zinc carboxypeptidase-like [Vollenhovia emeryi]